MPSINLSVPHKLGVEEAKKRIANLISESKQKFGDKVSDVRESWTANHNDFAFKAMGFSVSGNMDVKPSAVDLCINFPFAALPFKGRIENELAEKAKTLLA